MSCGGRPWDTHTRQHMPRWLHIGRHLTVVPRQVRQSYHSTRASVESVVSTCMNARRESVDVGLRGKSLRQTVCHSSHSDGPGATSLASTVDPSEISSKLTRKHCGGAVVSSLEGYPREKKHAAVCDFSNGVTWLEHMPRGAYTTCRTVRGGTAVFELSFHLQRLVDSLELMIEASVGEEGKVEVETSLNALVLKEDVLWTIRDAVEGYRDLLQRKDEEDKDANADAMEELKITVLVPYERPVSRVYTHVTSLGSRKPPGIPVRVEIRGEPRRNAAAKDSDWVTERKKLGKSDDVNEIVLEQNGLLYEGLSSNFFVLKQGVLYTAGEGVLLGSVREAVLRKAEALDIPIVLEPPHVDDIQLWDAAFISSTSRMLLPIDSIAVCRECSVEGQTHVVEMKEFTYGDQSVVRALENAVKEDILSSSETIFPHM